MLGGAGTSVGGAEFVREASAAASNLGETIRGIVPGQTKEEDNGACFSELSYQTRLNGFLLCFSVGFLLSILSTLLLSTANFVAFAILYSVGNVVSILATGFLVGPKRQCSLMFKKKRIVATIVFFVSLLLTLVVAFSKNMHLLVIPFIIIQWLAGIWYVASYIPFAQDAIAGCCKSTVSA